MFAKLSSLFAGKSLVIKALPVVAIAATALAFTAPAKADGFRIGFGFNFAPPIFYAPAYCAPAPVYAPRYVPQYAPAPVYVPPCPAPVYNQPVYVAPYQNWQYWHRREEWREHHAYRDRDDWRGHRWDRR